MWPFKNKKGVRSRSFRQSIKKNVWYNQLGKCNKCGKDLDLRTVNFDHIVRFADGGDSEIDNCQALCPYCHSMKTFFDNSK